MMSHNKSKIGICNLPQFSNIAASVNYMYMYKHISSLKFCKESDYTLNACTLKKV